IDHAAGNGISLIIALDCGIKSNDKVEYATTLGIDFIICDHHMPGNELPAASAVLDPKRNDCTYPFKELSGCGIGIKLIQAFAIKNNLPEHSYTRYLDLGMVSIAADMVSMTGENRVIAWHGLKKLNEDPCPGLKALMEISGRTNAYTITDVVFQIAPRINAAGRMGHATQAVKMLLCDAMDNTLEQSTQINSQNTDRKVFDQRITIEALAQIESDIDLINKKTTVVYKDSWNKGVIGIVASRLTEKYYRPTIVLTESNGLLTGSARSVQGFDLYEALLQCTDHLEQFGGHKFAAGLTLRFEDLEPFKTRFEEVVAASITEELLIPEIKLDVTIGLSEIDAKFCRVLGQMAPFGPDNMLPVFQSLSVSLIGQPALVGTDHLKFSIAHPGSPVFECIAFGMAEHAALLKQETTFSVCYTIEENNWRDKRTVQLNIKGIKLAT
ncbi:MAG: single-stranded-DNA-specific exonuclease RecJ, partial [Pedobacter sp.]